MKITISLGGDNEKAPYRRAPKPIHKKPWFWLLIVLIASVAVKMTTKSQPMTRFLNSENDDVSSTFSFDSKSDKLSEKNEQNNANEIPENLPDEENNESEEFKTATVNEQGKTIFHFILNTSNKKYHYKECNGVKKMSDANRKDTDIEADSFAEAKEIIEEQGYELCGLCDR